MRGCEHICQLEREMTVTTNEQWSR
jgi:hypothetical protein